jgi:hypothetical protein
MANTVTLTQTAYNDMLSRISKLEKTLSILLKKQKKEPVEGSDTWWDKSIKEGKEDIKNGNYMIFDSAKSLTSYLEKKL